MTRTRRPSTPLLLSPTRPYGPSNSGVAITEAVLDGDATVLLCDLLDDGQRGCRAAAPRAATATPRCVRAPMCRWSGIRYGNETAYLATGASHRL